MYCKDCGNVIDDDSKFCRFCGATQSVSSSENHQTQKLKQVEVYGNISANVAPSFPNLANFMTSHKKLVISYALWSLIQIVVLFEGNDSYGWSEFVIYAFIVPLLLYTICMLFKQYKVLMKLKSVKHKWNLYIDKRENDDPTNMSSI